MAGFRVGDVVWRSKLSFGSVRIGQAEVMAVGPKTLTVRYVGYDSADAFGYRTRIPVDEASPSRAEALRSLIPVVEGEIARLKAEVHKLNSALGSIRSEVEGAES